MKPTKEQVLAEPAGRQMDACVAEIIFSYEDMGFEISPRYQKPTDHGVEVLYDLPHYSTEIAAAWEVVEKMREKYGFLLTDETPWIAELIDCDFLRITGEAETAPLAICRASLLSVLQEH